MLHLLAFETACTASGWFRTRTEETLSQVLRARLLLDNETSGTGYIVLRIAWPYNGEIGVEGTR